MTTQQNQPFFRFCQELACPLDHIRQSWSGYNDSLKRGVFTVWDDLLDKEKMRYEFGEVASTDARFGARKLREHIKAIISKGGQAFGIQCIARDINANPRARKTFNREKVLSLRLTEEEGTYVAYVMGEVRTTSIQAGAPHRVETYPDAINDLDSDPLGIEFPSRTQGTHSGFSRDPKIRTEVLNRARGHCEYCGELGFLLWNDQQNDQHYVEAHHIIFLANNGADTMSNVIALCSKHHREAHYGKARAELEQEFFEILDQIR